MSICMSLLHMWLAWCLAVGDCIVQQYHHQQALTVLQQVGWRVSMLQTLFSYPVLVRHGCALRPARCKPGLLACCSITSPAASKSIVSTTAQKVRKPCANLEPCYTSPTFHLLSLGAQYDSLRHIVGHNTLLACKCCHYLPAPSLGACMSETNPSHCSAPSFHRAQPFLTVGAGKKQRFQVQAF